MTNTITIIGFDLAKTVFPGSLRPQRRSWGQA